MLLKTLLTTVSALFLSFGIFAQQNVIRCYTVENEAERLANGQRIETDAEFERWMAEKLLAYKNQRNQPELEVYTIPVVFHIFYRNASENISDDQILSQLDILNEDFGRYNPDTGNTPVAFRPVASNTGIQFCMAQRDPQGNPTNGIMRYSYPSGTTFSQSTMNNTYKPLTVWNTNDYLNIWVAPLGGGLLGYAQFPTGSGLPGLSGSGSATTDGVVLLHTSVGRPPANPFGGIYNGGRTATHEVGHYLGLRHIWGDGGCSVDDFCSDTPTSDAANYNCPTTHVSCGTVDMVQNYMDYTQDNCMNLYTLNQTDRMRVVMQNSPRRASLRTSLGCVSPVQRPTAGFFASADSVCTGASLQFGDSSANNPTTWKWLFPGATPDSSLQQFPSGIVYNNPGTYNVTLIVGNAAGNDTLVRNQLIVVSAQNLTSTLDSLPTLCVNGETVSLQAGQPRGGQYSGPGVVNGQMFNPALAGIGQHTLYYQAAGCSSVDSAVLTVLAIDTPVFNLTDSICVNAAPLTLQASPAGGTFSGPGVSNGLFNPAQVGAGLTQIVYTFTSTAGCLVSDTQSIVVKAAPVVNFSGQQNHCITEGTIQLVASPLGGVFSGPGVSANGQMNLQTAGAGVHQINYSFTDASGCTTSSQRTVIVSGLPVIVFNNPEPICLNGGNQVFSFASPGGGNYSGNGIQFGVFNPQLAGVGTHTIYYTTGVTGCQSTDSTQVVVFDVQTPEIIRQGDSLIASTQASSYQWYRNGQLLAGINSRSILPDTLGRYSVHADSANCSSNLSAEINFFFTSVATNWQDQFRVFPNPSADGQFRLLRATGETLALRISDLQGRLLLEKSWDGTDLTLDLSDKAPGMYLLQLSNNQQQAVIRLLKR